MKDKTIFIFMGGIMLLGSAIFFILQGSSREEIKRAEDIISPMEASSSPAQSGNTSQPQAREIPMGETLSAQESARVHYRAGQGFSPARVAVKKDGDDCYLRIKNESASLLVIRLSPHRATDNWGFPYPSIPAGEESIIDPRYRIEKIAFHNHGNPPEEFSVTLDPECLGE